MRAALLVALAACKGSARTTPPPSATIDAGSAIVDATAHLSTFDAGPSGARPHVTWLLEGFEHERDAHVRADLSVEISREDAVVAGVQDRVIALVRAYTAIPDGDWTASGLMMSLVKGDVPPPPAVGDLVLDLAEHGGDHTRFVAFHGLRKMRDRWPEVCELAVNLASTPNLPDVLTIVAMPENPCAPHLDPVIDAMVHAMGDDQFEVDHYLGARLFVRNLPLTPDQLAHLARGARAARKDAGRYLLPYAERLVRQIDRRRDDD